MQCLFLKTSDICRRFSICEVLDKHGRLPVYFGAMLSDKSHNYLVSRFTTYTFLGGIQNGVGIRSSLFGQDFL
jgi:hypothetical protein